MYRSQANTMLGKNLPHAMITLQMLRSLAVGLILLVTVGIRGEEVARFGQADASAINEMFDRYSLAFQKKDYSALPDYLGTPFVLFVTEPKPIETMEAVIQQFRNLRDPLDARGYDHSKYVNTRITVLAADRAFVNKTYRRFKKDGTVLEEKAAIYLVSKTGGSWKIYGVFSQELPYFGSVF